MDKIEGFSAVGIDEVEWKKEFIPALEKIC